MATYNPTGYDNDDPYGVGKKKKKKSPLRPPEETVTVGQRPVDTSKVRPGYQVPPMDPEVEAELNRPGVRAPAGRMFDLTPGVRREVIPENPQMSHVTQDAEMRKGGFVQGLRDFFSPQQGATPQQRFEAQQMAAAAEKDRAALQGRYPARIGDPPSREANVNWGPDVNAAPPPQASPIQPGYRQMEPAVGGAPRSFDSRLGDAAGRLFASTNVPVNPSALGGAPQSGGNAPMTGKIDRNPPQEGPPAPEDVYLTDKEAETYGLRRPAADVVQDSGNNTPPGSRPIYQNGANSYSDVQAEGGTPYAPSNPIRSAGVGSSTYDNTDAFGLRNGQGPGRMGVGGRVSGNASLYRPLSFEEGPKNPNTGRGTFTINHAGPLHGMGPVSGAALHQMAEQKRAKLQANRMSGAAEGGNILRQIARINRKADRAYQDALKRTHNPKVAKEMSEGIRAQADQLVGLDQNNARRYGDRLQRDAWSERTAADVQTAMATEQSRAAAANTKASAEAQDTFLENMFSETDKDGKQIFSPDQWTRFKAIFPTEGMTNLQMYASRPLMLAMAAYEKASKKTATNFTDIFGSGRLKKGPNGEAIFEGAQGNLDDVSWSEAWGKPGFLTEMVDQFWPTSYMGGGQRWIRFADGTIGSMGDMQGVNLTDTQGRLVSPSNYPTRNFQNGLRPEDY